MTPKVPRIPLLRRQMPHVLWVERRRGERYELVKYRQQKSSVCTPSNVVDAH